MVAAAGSAAMAGEKEAGWVELAVAAKVREEAAAKVGEATKEAVEKGAPHRSADPLFPQPVAHVAVGEALPPEAVALIVPPGAGAPGAAGADVRAESVHEPAPP